LQKSGKSRQEFKNFTARKILEAIDTESESQREWILNLFEFSAKQHKRNAKYQVWTPENHAEIIYSNRFTDQKIRYIHENPVRTCIVSSMEDYLYSSARNYSGLPGVLEIIPVHLSIESLLKMRTLR
jgi:hypothetical protein